MSVSREFREVLFAMDVKRARRMWTQIAPHLPQPLDDSEAERILHMARSEMRSIPTVMRQYSREWLAERYPLHTAAAVGIAVGLPGAGVRSRNEDVRHEMSEAVLMSYREGVDLLIDAPVVSGRMFDARAKVHRRIYGVTA